MTEDPTPAPVFRPVRFHWRTPPPLPPRTGVPAYQGAEEARSLQSNITPRRSKGTNRVFGVPKVLTGFNSNTNNNLQNTNNARSCKKCKNTQEVQVHAEVFAHLLFVFCFSVGITCGLFACPVVIGGFLVVPGCDKGFLVVIGGFWL